MSIFIVRSYSFRHSNDLLRDSQDMTLCIMPLGSNWTIRDCRTSFGLSVYDFLLYHIMTDSVEILVGMILS